ITLLCSFTPVLTGCGKSEKKETKEVIEDEITGIPICGRDDTQEIADYIMTLPKEATTLEEYEKLHITPDASLVLEEDRPDIFEDIKKFSNLSDDENAARTFLFLNESNKPIYIYVSHTSDGYFMYEYDGFTLDSNSSDTSNDSTGSGEEPMEAYACSFDDIMSIETVEGEDTDITTFYLVSDKIDGEDTLKKELEGNEYNYTDIFWLYDVNIVE
ncbi:MAG: hypothetical protein K6G11_05445, partial [Lachnospiraceae bacterium]|nr:hypothetical protein [Lachnospiraceae bacterium]